MDKKQFGKFIADMRKEKKLTQQMLAEQLHVTNTAVSKWERGLCYPDLTMLEPLASALEITTGELMSCQKAAVSAEASDSIHSLLDIAQASHKQQKKRIWLTAILIPLCLLLVIGSVIFFVNANSHNAIHTVFLGKKADTQSYFLYFDHKGQLYCLQCPDQQLYEQINTDGKQRYRIEYSWNSIHKQGKLLLCEAVDTSGVLGTPMDELGSSIDVGSVLGMPRVFKSVQNVCRDPDRPGKYLYTFRFYTSVGTNAVQTTIVTIEDCRSTVAADYDQDGIAELFVLTRYEAAPYMLCELEDGQISFLILDEVPPEIGAQLKAMAFDK